jgi:hypothetical protein
MIKFIRSIEYLSQYMSKCHSFRGTLVILMSKICNAFEICGIATIPPQCPLIVSLTQINGSHSFAPQAVYIIVVVSRTSGK